MEKNEREALNNILNAFEPLILAYTDTAWTDEHSNLAEVLSYVLELAEAFVFEPKAAKAISELIKIRDACVGMMAGYRVLKREILEV